MFMRHKVRSFLTRYIPNQFKNLLYKIFRFMRDTFRLTLDAFIVFFFRRRLYKSYAMITRCHFLICKDVRYVSISKYAVLSYLRFNPDSTVIVHCDSLTYPLVKKLYRFLPNDLLEVVEDIPNDKYPYISKGLLLLTLQGTKDVFLDVDTRINGKLPASIKPTTLVAEFQFSESVKFSKILKAMKCTDFEAKYLLNVTFVSWGGRDLGIRYNNFLDWSDAYMNLPWDSLLAKEAIPYFKRFVEQTFFSLVFQEESWDVLKKSDFVGDKGIVESSYFGASGYRFGR